MSAQSCPDIAMKSRRFAALCVTLLVSALAAPLAAPPAAAASEPDATQAHAQTEPASSTEFYPLPASGQWMIQGRGFGHGRGMSQWGAQAAALNHGLGHQEILNYYYPGTAMLNIGNPLVRVLLTAPSNERAVTFFPASGVAQPAVTTTDGRTLRGQFLTIRPSGTTLQAEVRSSLGGDVVQAGTVASGTRIVTDGGIYLGAGLRPTTATWYRSDVVVRNTNGFEVINELPMQAYLYGVVPREMPASFAAGALEAQAVAARTYQRAVARPTSTQDICDTTACQVYGGRQRIQVRDAAVLHNEHASTTQAVDNTRGIIRTTSLTDTTPAFMQYSSSSGGYTVAHPNYPYLQARPDQYSGGAPGDQVSQWQRPLTSSEVARFCPAGGSPTALEVRARDGNGQWGGRITDLVVHCTTGQRSIGTEFDRRLGMRSSWWKPTAPPAPPSMFYLSNRLGGQAERIFEYGPRGTTDILIGDWNGDGVTGIGYREGSALRLRNSPSAGEPDHLLAYGRPGDEILVGDWDGNGTETFAVRRDNTFHVKNAIDGGPADAQVSYGRADDEVFVGDWDGDGSATPGVRRGNTLMLKNSWTGGPADVEYTFGRATDETIVGNWDGSGVDRPAVRRGIDFYIPANFGGTDPTQPIAFGRATDRALVGDWNGSGRDTLGVHRLG